MNDDYKSDNDYVDIIQEEKKEIRNEIIWTVAKVIISLVVIFLVCFFGYKGVVFCLEKLNENDVFNTDTSNNGYIPGDSGSGGVIDDSGSSSGGRGSAEDMPTADEPPSASKCNGVYGNTKDGVDYDFILYDDGNYSAAIGQATEVGTYAISGNIITFTSEGISETFNIDTNCKYIEMDGIKLNKK